MENARTSSTSRGRAPSSHCGYDRSVESIDEEHARPPGASDALVAAAGAMSEAFERVERARGALYDVAFPIVCLCAPQARHVTGEILNVNGGSVLCG